MQPDYIIYILEAVEGMGATRARKMFGGWGIFCNDLMFGLVADGILYLKVDKKNQHTFEELSLEPFGYKKNGKKFTMSYFQTPDTAMENPKELLEWSQRSYQAAVRCKK